MKSVALLCVGTVGAGLVSTIWLKVQPQVISTEVLSGYVGYCPCPFKAIGWRCDVRVCDGFEEFCLYCDAFGANAACKRLSWNGPLLQCEHETDPDDDCGDQYWGICDLGWCDPEAPTGETCDKYDIEHEIPCGA